MNRKEELDLLTGHNYHPDIEFPDKDSDINQFGLDKDDLDGFQVDSETPQSEELSVFEMLQYLDSLPTQHGGLNIDDLLVPPQFLAKDDRRPIPGCPN